MSDPTTSASPLAALSDALADAVAKAGRSTVTVSARRRFGASGIAWTPGVIVTADHVIEQDDDIVIGLPGGGEAKATLAGRDPGSDLAALRITGGTLTPIERGPEARVGNLVLAIGRPAPGEPMASLGVVSAVGGRWRTFSGSSVGGYLRSDTTFFPGFSGGPLIDADGRALGINSSRLGRGAGMTIPIAATASIVDALLSQGRVRRGYLGISSQPTRLPEALAAKAGQPTGLLVIGVESGTPADTAGLLVGDILVRLGETAVTGTESLQSALGPETVGQPMAVQVLRGGEPRTVTLVVGERA